LRSPRPQPSAVDAPRREEADIRLV
jgi:hypothetical protein